MSKKKDKFPPLLMTLEKGPAFSHPEFEPMFLAQKHPPRKRGKKPKYPHDKIGSVNVRISTLALIHRIREQMAEIGAEKIALHEALDRVVKYYLDCAGDGAARKIPEHSRQERIP